MRPRSVNTKVLTIRVTAMLLESYGYTLATTNLARRGRVYLEDEADSMNALGEGPVSGLADAIKDGLVEDGSLEAIHMEGLDLTLLVVSKYSCRITGHVGCRITRTCHAQFSMTQRS